MKKLIYLSGLLMIMVFSGCSVHLPVTITVDTGNYHRFQSVVSIDLDSVTTLNDNKLVLYRVNGAEKTPVPIQIIKTNRRTLYWQLPAEVPTGTLLTYKLVNERDPKRGKSQTVTIGDGVFILKKNHRNVLRYQASTLMPPPGEDEAFKRSGFVHPLFAPNGAVLTEIQPKDHIHHYGIWNPWAKTTFQGEEVDFWNLKKRQGTVQHARVLNTRQGDVFSEMEFLHHHVAWPESARQTVAMAERHIIRSFNMDKDVFMVEFEFHLTPRDTITLEEYRYSGFVFRGTAGWTNQSSDFITSEGLDRDRADGQRARWCIVSVETPQGRAGIFFMGNPANYNHPEPLRVWPSDGNGGRGDVFINFSPTRNTSWELKPGNTYVLGYRLIVFNGEMDPEMAIKYWNDYANPVTIKARRR